MKKRLRLIKEILTDAYETKKGFFALLTLKHWRPQNTSVIKLKKQGSLACFFVDWAFGKIQYQSLEHWRSPNISVIKLKKQSSLA